jgi:hypothetical protein
VCPLANPNFDPAQLILADEGKAEPHGKNAGGKPKQQGKPPAKPMKPAVAGWQSSQDCEITIAGATIRLTSSGMDPFITTRLQQPLAKPINGESLKLEVSMKTSATGPAQFFWRETGKKKGFAKDRSIEFDIQSDGAEHTYSIPFSPKSPVPAIRLDPARSPGEITISALKIIDGKENTVYDWTF